MHIAIRRWPGGDDAEQDVSEYGVGVAADEGRKTNTGYVQSVFHTERGPTHSEGRRPHEIERQQETGDVDVFRPGFPSVADAGRSARLRPDPLLGDPVSRSAQSRRVATRLDHLREMYPRGRRPANRRAVLSNGHAPRENLIHPFLSFALSFHPRWVSPTRTLQSKAVALRRHPKVEQRCRRLR